MSLLDEFTDDVIDCSDIVDVDSYRVYDVVVGTTERLEENDIIEMESCFRCKYKKDNNFPDKNIYTFSYESEYPNSFLGERRNEDYHIPLPIAKKILWLYIDQRDESYSVIYPNPFVIKWFEKLICEFGKEPLKTISFYELFATNNIIMSVFDRTNSDYDYFHQYNARLLLGNPRLLESVASLFIFNPIFIDVYPKFTVSSKYSDSDLLYKYHSDLLYAYRKRCNSLTISEE